jgi:hypothetical protein
MAQHDFQNKAFVLLSALQGFQPSPQSSPTSGMRSFTASRTLLLVMVVAMRTGWHIRLMQLIEDQATFLHEHCPLVAHFMWDIGYEVEKDTALRPTMARSH